MILYCDTSALIKLYLAEAGSAALHRLVAESEAVATCRISWAEAHAALARRTREVSGDAASVAQAKRALAADWPKLMLVEITQELVERAAEYADTFALRGYDSVQLAAAHALALEAGTPVSFACFDDRLNKAAKVLAMQIPFAARSSL
jgi:predicted nucleic acid-binding protein